MSPFYALIPSVVALQLQHMSHVTQHFGKDASDFGAEVVALDVRWESKYFYFDISDGLNLNNCQKLYYFHSDRTFTQCGEIEGPKEVFSATFGIKLWQKQSP